jgi:hypothetical protein
MTVFLLYFCRAKLLAEEVWMIDGGFCQEREKKHTFDIFLTSTAAEAKKLWYSYPLFLSS